MRLWLKNEAAVRNCSFGLIMKAIVSNFGFGSNAISFLCGILHGTEEAKSIISFKSGLKSIFFSKLRLF